MLSRLWLIAIAVFVAGWIVVWAAPGSVAGGLAIYASTAVLVVLAIVGAFRALAGLRIAARS